MELDLFSLIGAAGAPIAQEDHFLASHLEELFRSKIAKSQATGKDGMRIGRFQPHLAAEAALIENNIKRSTYKFTTFKERLILRGADRAPRQISIPTVRDRLTLRAVCQVLHSHVPETLGSSPHALVDKVVKSIRTGDQTSKVFVRIDVRDFFPSISHAILARELRHFGYIDKVRELCRLAVQTATGSGGKPNERGVPQGLSVSGALSAIYMLRFDQAQVKKTPLYFRYVDDILIICDEKNSDEILKSAGRSLRSRGLIIHKKGVAGKTEIGAVVSGIDYLGYRISIDCISIRESSFKKMFKNLLKVLTDYKHRKDIDRLIFRINLKTTGCIVDNKRRGWMMFFSHTEDMRQLAFLDAFVNRQLSRVGFPKDRRNEIKRFIKSYHEIRYNMTQTQYIPNLDEFDAESKAKAIAALSPHKKLEEILSWDVQRIEEEFSRLISREVHDLEKDVGNPS